MRRKRPGVSVLALATALSIVGRAADAAPLGNSLPAAALSSARMVGALDPNRQITVALTLPLGDAKGAADFVAHATKRGDPLFRHWLTPQEFAARFGASEAGYQAAINWARSHQLEIGETSASRTVLPLRGTASQIEAAFGVRMMNFTAAKDGHAFYSADRAPTLPAEIAQHLSGVIGLSNYHRYPTLYKIKPAKVAGLASGTGPNGGYSAADIRSIYTLDPQMPATATQTVAVYEEGGFFQSDVDKYVAYNKLPNVPVIVRNVNGYGGGVNDPGVEIEAVLDIDMVIGANPAVKRVLVYEDGDDSFQVSLLSSLSAMATDNKAKTISISYGVDEVQQGVAQIQAENAVLTQLAAQGQAVFVSSGDDGAYGRTGFFGTLNAPDPGSQPLVTSVGGTTLFSSRRQTYQAEEAWNQLGSFYGATGGGVSAVWPIPSYQVIGGSSVALGNGGSATNRNVPDVGAVASPLTGVAVYSAINGGWLTIGGTSVSSPIWAGFYSSLNASNRAIGGGDIGFFNPSVYYLGYGFGDSFVFNDVADGSNGNVSLYGIPGYNAGFGYDNTVGWGSPNGANFLAGLLINPIPDGSPQLDPPHGLSGTTTKTTATVKWTPVKGAEGYLVLAFNIKTGARPLVQISKTPTVTFTGLHSGTLYEFLVTARNGGSSSQSQIYLTTQP